MPCYAMLCHRLCYAMLCHAMLCYAMLCHAMLCYAMLCHAMLCYVFRFFEKIEKSMPKWLPKSMKICPKSDLEPTWVDWFSDFGRFGRCQKIMNFWCLSGGSKKQKNWSQVSPRDACHVNDRLLLGARVPGAATRATRFIGQKAKRPKAKRLKG